MNLNERLNKLEVVMKSMQRFDQNGTWDEVVSDIRNGDEDIDQIILNAIQTLESWKAEDVNNEEYKKMIAELRKVKQKNL